MLPARYLVDEQLLCCAIVDGRRNDIPTAVKIATNDGTSSTQSQLNQNHKVVIITTAAILTLMPHSNENLTDVDGQLLLKISADNFGH